MIINVKSSRNSRFYLNKLYMDYIFDFPKVSDYFACDYRDIESYKKRMNEIEKSYDNNLRKGLVQILHDYNSTLGAGSQTLKNIRMLGMSGTAVIIGGQQPGLFTGPILIIYKIMTILKLSSFISEVTGIRIIPCFWNASDDSSIGQVDSMGIITGILEKIKIDTSSIRKNTRFSSIYLEREKYLEVLQNLEGLILETDFSDEALGLLRDSTGDKYRDPEGKNRISLPGLFSNMILKLFREYGIVMIDPSDKRLKRMGAGFLKADMEKYSSIAETVNSRGDKLERAGYHAQLDTKKNTLNHFFNVGGIREKVECLQGLRYRIRDKIYSGKELTSMADSDPGLISWNVAMRPVVQDSLFPVMATVCGPGEISYFAQISGVYDLMDIRLPVIYPRFSATIIEKKISRIIKRFESMDDLAGISREQALKKSMKDSINIRVDNLADDLEKKLEGVLENFEKEISIAGISTGSSFDRIKRNIKKEVQVLKGKIYSELKKENQGIKEALDKFYFNLFPEGGLQERQISFFYYANRYGIGIMEGLYDSFKPFDFEHKLLYLNQDGKNEKNR